MMKRFVCIIAVGIVAMGAHQACAQKQSVDRKAQARRHYDLGNLFYQQAKFEEAESEYQQALNLLKDSEPAALAQGAKRQAAAEPKKQPQTKKEQGTGEQKQAITEYTVGEEDVLKISVWQNPDLDQEAIVRPDGKISFPLIGDVPARGLTITALDEEITSALSEFVRSPEVSISLTRIGGSKVIVLGEISRPGVYSVAGTKTLLEAVGQAGGFTKDAVPSSTILIRGGFNNPQAQRLNLSKALQGKDVVRQNIVLQSEDIVFVPKKFIANLNYLLSEILDPLSRGIYVYDQLSD